MMTATGQELGVFILGLSLAIGLMILCDWAGIYIDKLLDAMECKNRDKKRKKNNE